MITYLLTMYVLINTQQFIIYVYFFSASQTFSMLLLAVQNSSSYNKKALIVNRDDIWQISRVCDSSMVHLLVWHS